MTTELQGNTAKVGLRISAEKMKAVEVGHTQALSRIVELKGRVRGALPIPW